MTALHTPGPWQIRIRDDGTRSITGAYRHAPGAHPWTGGILHVCDLSGDEHHDEANAALIAAAPETAAERDRLRAVNAELLAALKGLEHEMADCWDDLLPATQMRLRDARAAIARAEQS